jgi:hypothetical protein
MEGSPIFRALIHSWCGDQGLAGMTTCTDNLTDRQLLERFAIQRNEESFT